MFKYQLLSLIMLVSSLSFAQKADTITIVTDRPDLTESSRAVSHKSIQVETGIIMFVEQPTEPTAFKTTLVQFPAVLARIGLFKNVELRLFNQFIKEKTHNPSLPEKQRSTYGMDNFQIGTKINLTTEKGLWPEIALLSHLVLPVGSQQLENDKALVNFIFSLSHTLSNKFSLGYNLGWSSDNTNPNGTGIYTMALGYSISEKLGVFMECYGLLSNLETATLGFDGGFTYLLSPKMQLDVSAGKGISENNYFLSAGFSILIPQVF
ncbi:MAG: transporter [Cyclobacteriaceae bacterium]|nr:transporter [Cyclobacteriaceae bacterium]